MGLALKAYQGGTELSSKMTLQRKHGSTFSLNKNKSISNPHDPKPVEGPDYWMNKIPNKVVIFWKALQFIRAQLTLNKSLAY